MRVRRAAYKLGLRFRLHRADLPGKPDLVFPKYRVALFVHGCFWHRHPGCAKATTPKSRTQYWEEKFIANRKRDVDTAETLRKDGWKVVIVWECETRDLPSLYGRIGAIFNL